MEAKRPRFFTNSVIMNVKSLDFVCTRKREREQRVYNAIVYECRKIHKIDV